MYTLRAKCVLRHGGVILRVEYHSVSADQVHTCTIVSMSIEAPNMYLDTQSGKYLSPYTLPAKIRSCNPL